MNDTIAAAPVTEDAALSAAYDRLTANEPITDDPVTLEEPGADTVAAAPEGDVQQEEVAPEPEVVEAALPPGLSADFKDVWGQIDPEAQKVIVKTQNALSAKLANQGRMLQGIAPIRDVLVAAVNDLPQLRSMRPEDVATEVMALAKLSASFKEKPLETFLHLADQHGMREQLKAAFAGQAPAPQQQQAAPLLARINQLEQMLARVANPEYIQTQVSAVTAQQQLANDILAFSAAAEGWDVVEPHIPNFIPVAQDLLGEGASPKDVLERAYQMARQAILPAVAVNGSTAPKPADVERARAAQKAKAVNVPGRTGGSTVNLTEDEALSAAWDRAMRK